MTAATYVTLIWLAGLTAWAVWLTTALAYNKFDRAVRAVRHSFQEWEKRREEALRHEL